MSSFLRITGSLLVLITVAVSVAGGVGVFGAVDVLAFDSNRNGNYEIYLMDISTGVAKNMTHHIAQDRNPAWSPDGRYLAFESVQRDSGTGIYLIDLDRLDKPPQRVTPTFVRAVQPAWSPRGSYLAFSGAMDDMFNNEIFLLNLYDRQVIRVTNSPMEFDYGPAWSPDGSQLAYGVYDATIVAPSDVYVVGFQEMALQLAQARPQFEPVLVSDDETAADPFWTPDGTIIFRYDLARYTLYQTEPNADHTDQPLNELRVLMEKPAMSPDGKLIAYSTANSDRDMWRELHVANVDGSDVRPLTEGAAVGGFWDNAPAWKPR